jgi:uroporphyrinogen-III decarboxylase
LIHQDCAIANSGDQKMVHEMIDEFEDKWMNLGHGILPNIPVDHASIYWCSGKVFANSSILLNKK